MSESLRTIELPSMARAASIAPASLNDEDRSVDLIFTTGAAVRRFDWMTEQYYLEKLSLDPKHVRLERLNSGAPLLDTHSGWSLSSQIGVVKDDSASVDGKRGVASVRFSKRDDVTPIWADVQDKVYRNVSVGYVVYRYDETPAAKAGALPVRTAVDWEPYEISMVPMPADAGAKIRAGKHGEIQLHPCVIVTRQQETSMDKQTSAEQSEHIVTDNPFEAAPRLRLDDAVSNAPAEPTPAEVAMKAERARVEGIVLACRAGRISSAKFDEYVRSGMSLVDVQTAVFSEIEKRVDPNPVPREGARRVEMGDDPFIHVRAGIENALLHRVAGTHFKLEEIGRPYRGMTMLDVAKAYLGGRGIRVSGMGKMEVAGMALGLTQRGGMHTTSDFPLLLADVANKSLRAEYLAAPQTFQPITRPVSLSDFKPANRVQIGDAPALTPVNEHGEFQRGTIGEGREQIQLATYGRVFSITRKALVNDDTDAFSRVPAKFGRAARNLESDLVWYQILSNPTMGDGTALFAAGHGNYAGAGLIGIDTIGAGEIAMMLQTGLDGSTLIQAQPKYLIVPPSQKTRALQFVSINMQAQQASNINPFAGMLQVIAEPRLETGITIGSSTATGSAYAWYLAADPSQVDILEIAMLDGQEGPLVESRVGFDVDGLEIKCRHDVGAKVIDHRGLYKSDGSDVS